MPSVPWRLSRCCAAVLALLISAVGGFRAAVDQAPTARGSAVAVVRDLAGMPVRAQTVARIWQAPAQTAGPVVDAETVLIPAGRVVPAPVLRCGSALGPRAP